MAIAGEAPVGVGRGRGGGARGGVGLENFFVVTAEQVRLPNDCARRARAPASNISEFAVFDVELLPLDGAPKREV